MKTKDTTALITRLREFERRLQPWVDSVGKPETLLLVMDLLEYFDQPDAAPDLLAVCETIASGKGGYMPELRAAIAKAKGEA